MRKACWRLFLAGLIVLGVLFCSHAKAQEALTFDNEKDCLAVLPFSGGEDNQFYKPIELKGHGRMPVNGITQVLVSLPRNGCLHMKVMGGAMKYVPQREGTALRAHPKDGMLVIYARHDCGNPADAVVYPEPPKPQKGDPGKDGEPCDPLKNPKCRGPRGFRGYPGKNAVLPPPPPLLWGVSGGVSREQYSGPIADREICEIKGWTLNLGLVYGDPYRLFARATGMAVLIEDGSSSNYSCSSCGTVVAVSQGMRVLGGNLELVALIGPRDWRVQPTLYIEGGGGFVQGQVDRYVTRNGTTTTERVGAEELLGYKTQAHGGGGAGLTWHAASNFSLELTGGYAYPYGGSARVMLTKWFGKK